MNGVFKDCTVTITLLCYAKRERMVSNLTAVCVVCFDIAMSINVGFMPPVKSVHVSGFHHNEAVSGLKPEETKKGVLRVQTSARVQQVV